MGSMVDGEEVAHGRAQSLADDVPAGHVEATAQAQVEDVEGVDSEQMRVVVFETADCRSQSSTKPASIRVSTTGPQMWIQDPSAGW